MKKLLFLFICCAFLGRASAFDNLLWPQKTDSLGVWQHSHKRAAIWSACIPGAGQIYNERGYRIVSDKKHRAWWKVPIIYGGLGVVGYYFYQNLTQTQLIKEEILFRRENGSGTNLHPELSLFGTEEQLRREYDTFAQTRDLFLVGFIGVWGINVLEAAVDAHFVGFDVSEDVGLKILPTALPGAKPGISFTFTL